jgi:hypothetical protein
MGSDMQAVLLADQRNYRAKSNKSVIPAKAGTHLSPEHAIPIGIELYESWSGFSTE